jgi:hypothetical protein
MTLLETIRPERLAQPDIAYAPDYHKYLKRTQHRRATENLPDSLPTGFPKELKSDLVWEGDSVGNTYEWRHVLTASELEEIENALDHFKGKDTGSIAKLC